MSKHRQKINGDKTPKAVVEASSGVPRQVVDPKSFLSLTPTWAFRSFDWEGEWGACKLETRSIRKHFETHLASLEQMTWADILKASGGKKHGTNSHPIPLSDLSKAAQDRAKSLGLRVEEIFSLRLESTVRIYGIREGRELRVIWFDPDHGDQNSAVCPSVKRNT